MTDPETNPERVTQHARKAEGRRKRLAALVAFALTLPATSALADGAASWRFEAAASGAFTIASPTTRFDFGGTGVTHFLKPLVDDGTTPYGVLTFTQHPDSLALQLIGSLPVAAPSQAEIGAGLTTRLYPFRHIGNWFRGTGFVAAAGFSEALRGYSLDVNFLLGIEQFIGKRFLADVSFATDRRFSLLSDSVGRASTTNSGHDALTVNVSALLGHSRLLLAGNFAASWTQQGNSASVGMVMPLAASNSWGVIFDGNIAVTVYIIRRLSIGANVGVGGGSLERFVPQMLRGSVHELDVVAGGSVEVFVLPALVIRAQYAFGDGLDSNTGIVHRAAFSVGARF